MCNVPPQSIECVMISDASRTDGGIKVQLSICELTVLLSAVPPPSSSRRGGISALITEKSFCAESAASCLENANSGSFTLACMYILRISL